MKNHFSLTEVIFILVNIYNPKYKKPNIEISMLGLFGGVGGI